MRLNLFSMGRAPKKFLQNAGVLLFERTGAGIRVCVVQEKNGKWNIPCGGINQNEHPTRAAIRELREESSGVINYSLDERCTTIRIKSFHLVFIEAPSGLFLNSTRRFEHLREQNELRQRETLDMKWELVSELYNLRLCKKLRPCFASLLGDPTFVEQMSKLELL
jgi:8-oxo-dGTP pyrophosphatase MutT (NUDIX family)